MKCGKTNSKNKIKINNNINIKRRRNEMKNEIMAWQNMKMKNVCEEEEIVNEK